MRVNIDVENKMDSIKVDGYILKIQMNNDLEICKKLSESELNDLLDEIETVLGYKPIMEKFFCSVKDAKEIQKCINRNLYDCDTCGLKMRECYRCCKICESPLERILFKGLVENGFDVELQLRINKDNTLAHYPEPVDPQKILTIPDFYIETEQKKICIYTDGHTYHERTEYQAVRDRSIDRELQNLGYVVLRFTTSEVKQELEKVINCVKKTTMPGFDDNSVGDVASIAVDNGSCVRCGTKIPYSITKPMCDACYDTWSDFNNYNYPEVYCHKCGRQIDSISFAKPLCDSCSS